MPRAACRQIIQALDGTLDESLPFIGRLVEIDRRRAALTPIEFTDHSASDNACCQAWRSVIPSDGSPPMSGAANARDRHD
jgi:hypothetical protein